MTTCGRCGQTWGGTRTTHCTGCHETFTTHTNFDRHVHLDYQTEQRVFCRNPIDAGLRRNHHGRWTQAQAMPPEAKRQEHQPDG